MIKKIGIKNFRVFKDYEEFEFRPVTAITGTNSSGKSSLFKAIKLLRKNFENLNEKNHTESFDKLIFQNEGHNLGGFSKVYSKYTNSKELTFKTNYYSDLWGEVIVELIYEKDENSNYDNGKLKSYKLYSGDKLIANAGYRTKADVNKNTNDIKTSKPVYYTQWFLELKKDAWIEAIYNLQKTGSWQSRMWHLIEELKKLNWAPLDGKYTESLSDENQELLKECNDKGITFDRSMLSQQMERELFGDAKAWKVYDLNNNLIEYNNLADNFINKTRFSNVIFAFRFLKEIHSLGIKDFKNIDYSNIEDEQDKEKAFKIAGMFLNEGISTTKELISLIRETEHDFFENEVLEEFSTFFISKGTADLFGEEYETEHKFSYIYFKHEKPNEHYYSYLKNNNKFIQKLIDEEKDANPDKKLQEIIDFLKNIVTNEIQNSFKAFLSFNDFVFVDSDRADIQRLFFDSNNSQFGVILKDFQNLHKDVFNEKLKFIDKWVQKFEIADKLILERDSEGIGVRPYLVIDGEKTLMADLGFGVNQLLPMIIRIATVEPGSYMFIEEPESNLHPAFQSKLADLFSDSYSEFGIHFIIETHSEYLIRKLQTLIAGKNNLTNEDVAVYYLHNPKNIPQNEKQIYKLKIRDDGFMDNDFGKGFFDEASSLTMDLLNFKNLN